MLKLTIAISTYNRCNYLQECLDSILMQITDGVDIFVTDNASTDDTKQIIHKYTKYPFIHYYRNDQNLGPDGNILNCLKKAQGEYIHLMSDDDIMLPGTIQAIIDCIDNTSPDFIHLNTCSFVGKFTGVQNCSYARFPKGHNFVTKDKNEFVKKVGIYITFLSSLVLKKKYVKQISKPEQFLGTFFLQSHIAFLTTEGDKTLVILNHNSIAGRGGNSGGYNLYKIWISEYKKLLLITAVKSGYDARLMKKLYVKSIKETVRSFIFCYRIFNTGFELNDRSSLLKNTYMYPTIWLSVYPIAYLPIGILKLVLSIKRNLFR